MRWLIHLCVSCLLCAAFPGRAGERALVGFSQDTLANDWRAAQVEQFVAALAGHPEVTVKVTNAGGSTAQQIMDIENLVAEGVRVLVTSPRDGIALAPAIAAAYRKGVPVVLLTRRAATESYTAFIGPDDRDIGRRAGEVLARRLGGRGRVLMLMGVPTASTALARADGLFDAVAGYPDLDVLTPRPGNYLRADALQVVEDLLASGMRFDAIFAQSDSMASGARMALRRAGIDPADRPTVGVDYIAESREAIRSGQQLASLSYPTCGAEGAEVVLRLLKGQTVPRENRVRSALVTRENVDAVAPVF